ncbi:hydrophobin-315 [Coprinopsis sp. MPI-PUGE-AT-0042]|nr:hydrophobin-315 [Coprinopsis sp. MPI-PUGE-AT-0042]
MFVRLSTVVLAFTLVAGVLAAPTPSEVEYEQCNGGTVQCCNSTENHKSLSQKTTGLLALLGVDVNRITASVGVQCSSINVLSITAGQSCTQQTVCCSNNNFEGVVALGCNPINISL